MKKIFNLFLVSVVLSRDFEFATSFSFNPSPARKRLSLSKVLGETNNVHEKTQSKRNRILRFVGLRPLKKGKRKGKEGPKEVNTCEITTVDELDNHFDDIEHRFRKENGEIDFDAVQAAASAKGDTQIIGSSSNPDFVHPVLKLMHERRRTKSPLTPIGESRPDGEKIALVVEGGGMRGCGSAGMVTAIHYLGLEDTFDVIYGSSAGTVIGSYFNTRQLPWFGPELYYDSLTTAGSEFIDKKRLLRSLGFGLFDPRLYKDVLTRRNNGKPVLSLDFLLRKTMQIKKPLDWEKFVEMQKVQPVKVVSSALKRKESIVLSMENGAFSTIEELACCMQSSCLLPGVAGPLMNLNTSKLGKSDDDKFVLGNNIDQPLVEPLADALVFEPLPYRTAINEGATNVVVLRTRPDGVDVVGKTSPFEKLIFKRFFGRKNRHLKDVKTHMLTNQHKKLYGRQVLELNRFANMVSDEETANIMTVALPPGSPEVGKLETRREVIFEGVRRGFARAYDCLVEDPNERGRGHIVAKQVLPDEILDYDPTCIDEKSLSAFEYFLKENESVGKKYSLPSCVGKTAQEAAMPR